MKKQSLFFVPGIILIGVSLRTPFTVLPIILGNISQGLEVEVSSLGVLTSLPLLMFTLFSPFSTQLAQKIGLEHLFTYSLFFLTIGSLIRLINLPLLYLGTLMVGASVAVINVLLPSLIQANQPKKIGFLTTLYVTSMGIATALASYLAVPITQASSWKGLILLLTLLCLATFLVWLPNHRYNHRLAPQTKQKSQIKVMRNKQVWAIIIFSGFQSLIFYTVMTWLPTMSIHAGLSSHEAGLLTSILSLISIPFSMTIPSLTTSLSTRNRQLMLTLVSLAGVIGISMLFFPINNFIYWLAIHLLIGTATSTLFPYLMVNFSLKTSAPEKTAQLSGLSQTGGYILAAFGPTLFGYSFDLFHSWVPSVAALLLIDILMTVALFTVDRADKIL
ncbi:cyanate permease [Streptococcus pneumoniae]|nr:cyanate permease [Streptococcus pneumoniae]VMW55991.1 cyanate permease [Streptococcus pneumoniae]VNI91598.1 cyanate permease [Streptococcus pneumoniae]VPX81276.1 cyanate permease [Streptococcus pneumoniae]